MLFSIISAVAVAVLASDSLASPIISSPPPSDIGIQELQVSTDCPPNNCQTRMYSYAASNRKSFAPVDRCQEYNQGCKNIIKKYGYKEKDFKITQGCTDDKAKGVVTVYCTHTEQNTPSRSAYTYTGEVAVTDLNYVPVEKCQAKPQSEQIAPGLCKVAKPDITHARFKKA